jgi:hypothetical protein
LQELAERPAGAAEWTFVAGCGCDDLWWVRQHLGDRWDVHRPRPPVEPDEDEDDGYYRVPVHPPFDQLFPDEVEVRWGEFVRAVGDRLGVRPNTLTNVDAMTYIEELCRRISSWWDFRAAGERRAQVAELVRPAVDVPIPDAVLKVLVRGFRHGKPRPTAEKEWRRRVATLIGDLESRSAAA